MAELVRVLCARVGAASERGVRRMGRRRASASAVARRLTVGRSEARRRKEKRASSERTSVKMNDQTVSTRRGILLKK